MTVHTTGMIFSTRPAGAARGRGQPGARRRDLLPGLLALLLLAACVAGPDDEWDADEPENAHEAGAGVKTGEISYYGGTKDGYHCQETAFAEARLRKDHTAKLDGYFNRCALTAAHKTLPFGTCVRVTNPRNQKSVTVRITDRGPYHGNRVLDLSARAMRSITSNDILTAEYQVLPTKDCQHRREHYQWATEEFGSSPCACQYQGGDPTRLFPDQPSVASR